MRIVPGPEGVRITICACTYRRPAGLAALLEGLARQTFKRRERPKLGIVIVDNERSDQAKELCDQFRLRSDTAIRYVHEPKRGISYARNRCLDEIADDCNFFAIIDDDEVPQPDWIEQLLEAQMHTGADVVEGRVIPVFPDSAPEWIVQGHYFGWHRALDKAHRAGQVTYPPIDEARTNNVLVRCAVLRKLGLRFDPQFGLSGGGDIVFFRAISAAGHRIVYAPDACVREMIPLERTSLRYLWQRWYSEGSNARFKRPIRRKPNAKLKRKFMWKWHSSGCAAFSNGLGMLISKLLRGRIDVGHLAPSIKRVAHGLGQAASAIGIGYEKYRDDGMDRGAQSQPRHVVDR